jgi:ArsR family transcriptional regulator
VGIQEQLSSTLHALADPTRRELLRVLREEGDQTAGALAERFPLSKSTLSGHFAVLKAAGLVVTERQGARIVYSINQSSVEEALGALLALFTPSSVPMEQS